MSDAALRLAQQLIARASVTPEDGGCLDLITAELQPHGFACERIDSGPEQFFVRNLWALRQGSQGAQGPTVVFAGHVDVVPPGPLELGEPELTQGCLVLRIAKRGEVR